MFQSKTRKIVSKVSKTQNIFVIFEELHEIH